MKCGHDSTINVSQRTPNISLTPTLIKCGNYKKSFSFQNIVVSVINQENGPGKSAADGRERIDYYCEELNNLLNELFPRRRKIFSDSDTILSLVWKDPVYRKINRESDKKVYITIQTMSMSNKKTP